MTGFRFDYRETTDKDVLEKLHAAIKLAEERGFTLITQSTTNTLLAVKNNKGFILTKKAEIEK